MKQHEILKIPKMINSKAELKHIKTFINEMVLDYTESRTFLYETVSYSATIASDGFVNSLQCVTYMSVLSN